MNAGNCGPKHHGGKEKVWVLLASDGEFRAAPGVREGTALAFANVECLMDKRNLDSS